MMRVLRPKEAAALTRETRTALKKRQAAANRLQPKSPRIESTWNSFRRSAAGSEVRTKLKGLFNTTCAYCEIILPKDIEHFYPKSRFPKKMFRWDNLLWSCKNCNTEKLDDFPRLRGGKPKLLDPCRDDPIEFFTWDRMTGMPVLTTDPARRIRGEFTVATFDLENQQLCDERRDRARKLMFLLLQCIKKTPVPPDAQSWLLDELAPPRPFRSVLRQIVRDPANHVLVGKVKCAVPSVAPLLSALEV